MSFVDYKKRRDEQMFFESAGFQKNDVQATSKAMANWVAATEALLEAIGKVPVAFGEIGGLSGQPKVSENALEQELALEVQRARNTIEDAGLNDLLSRMNQYSARIANACGNLSR